MVEGQQPPRQPQDRTLLRASPYTRVLGFMIDYVVIAVWIGALFLIQMSIGGSWEVPEEPVWARWPMHLMSFLSLTLPVVAYFALRERYAGGSLGKTALGLRVVSTDGGVPPLPNVILRNLIKFLPWEAAHAAIWYQEGQPFLDPPGTASSIVFILALLASLIFVVSIFWKDGRAPYERLSGTKTQKIHKPQ